MKSINFISGLPRSGSTLLAAILRQNPEIHAGMTSPLYGIVAAAMRAMSGDNEASVFIDKNIRGDILDAIIDSYYDLSMMGSKRFDGFSTIFDTSRAWSTKAAILFDLFPDARMICCVRNPAWIIDSFERAVQANKFQPSKMFHHNPNLNVYQRTNQLTAPDGIIGCAYNNLREAFFGPLSDRLMLVDYETLCRTPQFVIESVYQFCQLGPMQILDLNNVEYSAEVFDANLGLPGLHTVKRKVEPWTPRPTILPADIFAAHKDNSFWHDSNVRALSNAVVL